MRISKKMLTGLLLSSLYMGGTLPVTVNTTFATEVTAESDSLPVEDKRANITKALENITIKLQKFVDEDKAHELTNRLISSGYYDISNWDDNRVNAKYDEVLTSLEGQLIAIDLVSEVVTGLNVFYERQGTEFRIQFEDIYQGDFSKSSLEPLIKANGLYTFSLANTVIHPSVSYYDFMSLYTGNPNDMIRKRNNIVGAIEEKQSYLADVREVRKAYNEVINLFNHQPEERRKEQFAEVDNRLSVINILGNRYYDKENNLRNIALLKSYIMGELADDNQREEIVERLLNKEKELFTYLATLSFVEIDGERTPYYIIKNMLNGELTQEELASYEITEEKRLETYKKRIELISDILSKEHDLFKKYGLEHNEKLKINFDTAIAIEEATQPTESISSPEEYFVSKQTLRTHSSVIGLPQMELIRYGTEEEIEEAKVAVYKELELVNEKYQAETEILTKYNSLAEKINKKPMSERETLGQKLMWGELTYRHLFFGRSLESSFEGLTTREEILAKKEAIIAELNQFEQEFFDKAETSDKGYVAKNEIFIDIATVSNKLDEYVEKDIQLNKSVKLDTKSDKNNTNKDTSSKLRQSIESRKDSIISEKQQSSKRMLPKTGDSGIYYIVLGILLSSVVLLFFKKIIKMF